MQQSKLCAGTVPQRSHIRCSNQTEVPDRSGLLQHPSFALLLQPRPLLSAQVVMSEIDFAPLNTVFAHMQRNWLLYVPAAALATVLQKLDACSLARTAATCTGLSHAVTETINTLVVHCTDQAALDSLVMWLGHNNTSLTQLTQCSLSSEFDMVRHDSFPYAAPPNISVYVRSLPCSQLRQLHLQRLNVQLEQAYGWQGVLHASTALTALELQDCRIQCTPAAVAALAALTQLRSLALTRVQSSDCSFPAAADLALGLPSSLTHLSIELCEGIQQNAFRKLSQLSALVSLEQLKLTSIRDSGVPGCDFLQLAKLTCLHWHYAGNPNDPAQYQHLSALTALRKLSIKHCSFFQPEEDLLAAADYFHCLQHLTQLTALTLEIPRLVISTVSTPTESWPFLTSLRSLALARCIVQPRLLATITQLQALSLRNLEVADDASLLDLLDAVSQLSLLTKLCYSQLRPFNDDIFPDDDTEWPLPPAGSYTALTASTNLCSLQVDFCSNFEPEGPHGCTLFRLGTFYQHLRQIDLWPARYTYASGEAVHISEQQLRQLCSCCPAVNSLAMQLHRSFPPEACLPLLQLTELTSLRLYTGGAPAVAAAAVNVAAQLTGLRLLELQGIDELKPTVLLQLTALTTLTSLRVKTSEYWADCWLELRNKARCNKPPDVWRQLLQRLLTDKACRQALLLRSSGAAPAPPELMLAHCAALSRRRASSEHIGPGVFTINVHHWGDPLAKPKLPLMRSSSV